MFIDNDGIWTRPPSGGPCVFLKSEAFNHPGHDPPDGGRNRPLLGPINMTLLRRAGDFAEFNTLYE